MQLSQAMNTVIDALAPINPEDFQKWSTGNGKVPKMLTSVFQYEKSIFVDHQKIPINE